MDRKFKTTRGEVAKGNGFNIGSLRNFERKGVLVPFPDLEDEEAETIYALRVRLWKAGLLAGMTSFEIRRAMKRP